MNGRLFFFCCILINGSAISFKSPAQAFSHLEKLSPTACDSAATRKSGTFKKVEDADAFNWESSFVPEMTSRTDALVEITKQAFPGTKGFDAEYLREMHKGSFVHDGPKVYDLNFLFLRFGCIYNIDPLTKKSVPTGQFNKATETGTWLYFHMNNPAVFFQSKEKMMIDGKEHEVYGTFPIAGTWKGMEVYGSPEFFSGETWTEQGSLWVLITRKNESAFVPVTRKQYLTAKLLLYDAQYLIDSAHTPVSRLQYVSKQYFDKRKHISDWLASSPPDSLNLPAIIYSQNDTDPCGEWFHPTHAKKGAPQRFVIARHEYWRLNEPNAAPQIIAMKFRYQMADFYSLMIKQQFERNFPLEKLQDLLDK
jgi:hypothetical protein